ncbi:MAG: HU family DNA-binding protein [Chloroflexota bacterium]
MTVKFTVVPRKDPRDPDSQPKFYAMLKSVGRADKDRISALIARMSSMSSTDTIGMLEAFLNVVPDELAEGRIVELGDFGTFRLSVTSEGSETAEEVTSANIANVKVLFTPGKRFKQVLANLKFQKEAAESGAGT